MWALKLLVVLVATYAAVALIVFAAQTRLLFPTSLAGGHAALPHGAERIALDTPDGERLHGVRIPSEAASGEDRTIVLGFGGNAWNAEDMATYLHDLYPEAEVVAFHYRGYRPSTGRPSAAALLDDGPLVYDFISEGRDPAKIVAVAFSIGSGVAVRLARERPLDGLILVAPFDTLRRLAQQHYGWLPVGLLLQHHMSPLRELGDVTAPVALIAAEQDTIIPEQRTAPLRDAARTLIMDQSISGAGHNDIYSHPEFAKAMRQALKRIENLAMAAPAKKLATRRE
jgi:pimeloyl-ACP methyl ester carboxylesterase